MKLALVLLIVATLGAPAHAHERKRIALLEFTGPSAANVRGSVMRLALPRCWVSSASTLDGRSVRDFAFDYEVDIVVAGRITKRGTSYEARIRFLRGTTGRTITHARLTLSSPSLDRAAQRQVERELIRALAAVPERADADSVISTGPP